jgi:hypothetical protein
MSIREHNTRSKSCPICSEVFAIRSGTRRRVLNTKVRRHVKAEHHDYYVQVHRWDRRAIFYSIFGWIPMQYSFLGVCQRYSSDTCGPPIIREGINSLFFPVALAIFIAPVVAVIVRRLMVQEKFRSDWQATHGHTSMGNERYSQTVPVAPPPTDQKDVELSREPG